MEYNTVCGLEVHTELSTKTKIFCNCSTAFGGEPNSHVCEICAGMPGTLPVVNERVVEYAVRTGLATNCTITRYNKFDRKNYFIPICPKHTRLASCICPFVKMAMWRSRTKSTAAPRKCGSRRSTWRRTPASWCTMSGATARW